MEKKMTAVFFLVYSLAYLFFAQEFKFGILEAPKAGFLPTLSGIIAIVLSLVIVFQQILQGDEAEVEGTELRKVIFVILGLLFFVVILNIVGYFAATFIIMLYLLKITDTAGWTAPLCLSLGIALGCYLVFKQYLGICLP